MEEEINGGGPINLIVSPPHPSSIYPSILFRSPSNRNPVLPNPARCPAWSYVKT